jgi:hypothetical protein
MRFVEAFPKFDELTSYVKFFSFTFESELFFVRGSKGKQFLGWKGCTNESSANEYGKVRPSRGAF